MLETIMKAGVVGGGGAGFPTWKKLDTTAEVMILNAAECEPILETDKYILRKYTRQVLQGLLLAAKQVGAGDAAVVIKDTYHREIRALEEAVSRLKLDIRLQKVRPVYPAGDEHVAVYESTGRVVPPGGIPGMVGSVVISVSTAYNLYRAVEEHQPVIRRLITVYGEVAHPQILDVPVGISVRECIESAGGATLPEYRVILGGPMMGRLTGREEQLTVPIAKTDSGVFVVPPGHRLARLAEADERWIRNRARSVCIQCRYCTEQCPRYLLGHSLHPHRVMRALALGEDLENARDAALCSECGVCEIYACPMGLSPRRINKLFKPLLAERGIVPDKTLDPSRGQMRFARQIPAHRLALRAGVGGYWLKDTEDAALVETSSVVIPLKQHIGSPAVPVVKTGDRVEPGTQIAVMEEGRLGAFVHASIGGVVEKTDCEAITITGGQQGGM